MDVYCIDGNQFVIICCDGTFCVLDLDGYAYYDNVTQATIFSGSFEECFQFRTQQELEYGESLF